MYLQSNKEFYFSKHRHLKFMFHLISKIFAKISFPPNIMSSTKIFDIRMSLPSSNLIYMLLLSSVLSNPICTRYLWSLSYQALGACFNPCRALCSLQTFSLLFSSTNPYGCSMQTSSSSIPFRNVELTYIWWTLKLL